MGNVGLLHNSLNNIGGAECFTLDLISVLKSERYKVNLATFDKVNWETVRANFGSFTFPDKTFHIFPVQLNLFSVYQRILVLFLLRKLVKSSDVTINTHSDFFFPLDITYIHGVIEYGKDEQIPRWKLPYLLPYFLIGKKLGRKKTTIVVNSFFTANKLKKVRNVVADHVIYPPVHTERYSPLLEKNKRQNLVIAISRFAKEKNIEEFIEIAGKCPDVAFVLIGHTNNKLGEQYAQTLKLKANPFKNLQILSNISQREKRKYLSKAKVYLQPSRFEHFGIAVVEAVSSGCFPVVVNEGGSLEIVEGITTGYDTYQEAVTQIKNAVQSWKLSQAKENSCLMESFGLPRFRNDFLQLLECIQK